MFMRKEWQWKLGKTFMWEIINNKIIDNDWYEKVSIFEFSSLNYNPMENILKKVI